MRCHQGLNLGQQQITGRDGTGLKQRSARHKPGKRTRVGARRAKQGMLNRSGKCDLLDYALKTNPTGGVPNHQKTSYAWRNAMTDLSNKPCNCGGHMGEVIGFRERSTDQVMMPYRPRWYCPDCHAVEEALGRETWVDFEHLIKKMKKSHKNI